MTQPIIDSHIHFWDPHNLQYPWLADVPAINKVFLPLDLVEQAAGVALEKIVFVQCDCIPEHSIKEVEWGLSLAKTEPRIEGIVAFAPLEYGEATRDTLQQLANLPLVKGIRRLIQSEGAGFCINPDFVKGVQLLPKFGFSFDICVFHHQLGDVLELVKQCPDVSFVLDHIGKPAIKDGLMEPWESQIKTLAAFSNVSCKISGLVTEANPESWTLAQLQPYIDHIINVFGIDRVMYGGDWPVSLTATTYPGWIDTLNTATTQLSAEEKQKLFYRNAATFYRLG